MLKRSILAAFVIAAAPLTALAQDQNADSVVAKVNDQDITLGQMIVMRQSLQPQSTEGMTEQAIWDMMLDQLIKQTAVAETASEDMNAAVRAQMELQRRNMLANAAIQAVAEIEPTDEEIRAAYDEMFAQAEPVTEYSAAHILVGSEDEAKAIKAELDGGADFGEQAEEHSTDNSGPNKGDLGWFTPDQMVEPFGNAVQELEKDQVSDPIETQFGWHIIKLNDTRLREAPALEVIQDQLAQMVRRDKVEAEIERIVGDANIEKTEGIDPALAVQIELLEAE